MTENELINTDDVDLSSIDISFPRLVKNTYEFLVKNLERKTEGENDYLSLTLNTTNEAMATDGTTLKAGSGMSTILGLKPFEGETMDNVNKRLAAFVQSSGKKVSKSELLSNPAIMNGSTVYAKVGLYKSKKDDSERNSFTFIVKK